MAHSDKQRLTCGPQAQQNAEASAEVFAHTPWMVTISDLMMLLLTVFVMRLSMSSLPAAAVALGSENGAEKKHELVVKRADSPQRKTEILLPSLSSLRLLPFHGEGIRVWLDAGHFLLENERLSFRGIETVAALAAVIRARPRHIKVVGYASNNAPIESGFVSNWDFSAARAINVARQMIDAGVDHQTISVMGFGDTGAVIDSFSSPSDRLNDGVEIFIPHVS